MIGGLASFCCCCPHSHALASHSRPEYQEALTRILDLAPPSSTTLSKSNDTSSSCQDEVIFSSRRQQAILVTQVGMANNNATTTTTTKRDEAHDVFEWPRDHSSFLESCESGVLLNIAAAPCPPFQRAVGKETVLVSPGSLRESGDYCLIDIGIHQDATTDSTSTPNLVIMIRVIRHLRGKWTECSFET